MELPEVNLVKNYSNNLKFLKINNIFFQVKDLCNKQTSIEII